MRVTNGFITFVKVHGAQDREAGELVVGPVHHEPQVFLVVLDGKIGPWRSRS